MSLKHWCSARWFGFVHGRNLVYNACWEDPRLDRQALAIGPDDDVLVITSAGCNALDYLLAGARRVFAVDVNPRQNALLELKIAAIEQLDYEQFFQMFGRGRLPNCKATYETRLRTALSPPASRYWDRRIGFFSGRRLRRSFYFRGTSGAFARAVNLYIDRVAKMRDAIDASLEAPTLAEQRAIYYSQLKPAFWSRFIRWAVGRDATLSLLGVPQAQRLQVERDYAGGIARFIEDCLEAVFTSLPLADNYFWRVYLTGEYSPACCPEYLKRENFARLKEGLTQRLNIRTQRVDEFLREHREPISKMVLLDHMDWLEKANFMALEKEWQAIVDRAAPEARIIWRSGGLGTEYVDRARVRSGGCYRRVGELLTYDRELASWLHSQDRVHTYGSFHIATVVAA